MSLINDALKRASQAQKRQPREAPIDSPMEPVAHAARPSRFPLYAGITLAVVVLAAGWFLWRWWQAQNETLEEIGNTQPSLVQTFMGKKKHKMTANTPGSSQTKPPVAATSEPLPPPIQSVTVQVHPKPAPAAPVTTPTPAPTPSPAPPVIANTQQPKAAPTISVAPTPAPPAPPPPFPTIKISAIFYRASKPLVVINTATVGIGDTIGGVRVVKIEPQRVTLEFNGQIKEFFMDGP